MNKQVVAEGFEYVVSWTSFDSRAMTKSFYIEDDAHGWADKMESETGSSTMIKKITRTTEVEIIKSA